MTVVDLNESVDAAFDAKRKLTHWARWDAPGKRDVQALCGAFIRRRDHSNDPTCQTCCRRLAELNALDI